MRFKCPECETEMSLSEEQHVCPNEECGKTLSIDEASALFAEGEIVALAEEDEVSKIQEGAEGDKIVIASIDEDIAALTEGEELSEEFIGKAKTIFEAAVTSRVAAEVKRLSEEKDAEVEQLVSEEKEKLADKINGYLDVVVAEWVEDNRVGIEEGLKAEMNEAFVDGLATLFKEHFIKVPGERWDIVEGLAEKVDELEGKLDESIEKNGEVKKELFESKKVLAVIALSEGLADTQKEKFNELLEGVEAESLEDFNAKATVIKESYFGDKSKSSAKEDDAINEGDDKSKEGAFDPMAAAIAMLNRKP